MTNSEVGQLYAYAFGLSNVCCTVMVAADDRRAENGSFTFWRITVPRFTKKIRECLSVRLNAKPEFERQAIGRLLGMLGSERLHAHIATTLDETRRTHPTRESVPGKWSVGLTWDQTTEHQRMEVCDLLAPLVYTVLRHRGGFEVLKQKLKEAGY